MIVPQPEAPPWCWVIAVGNAQREDDGIGPFIADCLFKRIQNRPGVMIASMDTLDPTLLEEVQAAECILFVDACVDERVDTVRWLPVEPNLDGWVMGSHHLSPEAFLGLLRVLYHRQPMAWVIAVRGDSFGLARRISRRSCVRAEVAVAQIAEWLALTSKTIEKEGEPWLKETIS